MEALRTRLEDTFSNYLPEFMEFQQFGYNMLFPKAADIDALQSQLRSMGTQTLRGSLQGLLEPLRQPAEAFLDQFRLFRNKFRQFREEKGLHDPSLEDVKSRISRKKDKWDDDARQYEEVMKHANRLVGYLSGTLDLIQTLNDNREHSSSWEDFQKKTAGKLRDEILQLGSAPDYIISQTRANLGRNTPEKIKFNRIVNSATWDERQEREALSAQLTGQAEKLLSGIKLTGRYAKKTAKENEVDSLAQHLAGAYYPGLTVEYAKKTDKENGVGRFAKHLCDVCDVLPTIVKAIKAQGEGIRPSAEILPVAFKLPKQKKGVIEKIKGSPEEAKPHLKTVATVAKQKALGAKDIFVMLSDKAGKNKHRAAHALPFHNNPETNQATRKTNEAVFQAGMILSDKIQQTVSNINKVRQAARPLQHAVELGSGLSNELPQVRTSTRLDAKLEAESARWKEKAGESKKQLQETLGKLTALAGDPEKNAFLSQLRTLLREAPQDRQSASIIGDFDAQIKAFVDTLAAIEKGLGLVTVRLSEHGVAGGSELDENLETWLRELGDVKRKLKTSITQATGRSINNFSRSGMLARRMGEWSESEKQRYLAELSPEDRTVAETQYDTLFFEVLNDYLPLLSKDTDPKGASLLQRLRIEVGNASQGTTLYPATMAEILAGMKSTDEAIRSWARRRLVRTVLLAAALQPVTLIPNLAALPLRVAVKFVITGAKVAWVAHKGRQGIRGGEGDVSDEIREYAKRSFITTSIKVVLALPPGLATTLGVAVIALDVYEGGLIGAAEKIAKEIVGEAPWLALGAGSREAMKAYVSASLD
ncbi:hypothetical protein, partial [Collimonas humicola]|uniref:hypothetical protein n=1 Tax=Collimonas humicola TaxID=2825886 RepID=UPI001B8BC4A6